MSIVYVDDPESTRHIKTIAQAMSNAGAEKCVELMEKHDLEANLGMALGVAACAFNLIGAVGTLAEVQGTPWEPAEQEAFHQKVQELVHTEQHRLHAKYKATLN